MVVPTVNLQILVFQNKQMPPVSILNILILAMTATAMVTVRSNMVILPFVVHALLLAQIIFLPVNPKPRSARVMGAVQIVIVNQTSANPLDCPIANLNFAASALLMQIVIDLGHSVFRNLLTRVSNYLSILALACAKPNWRLVPTARLVRVHALQACIAIGSDRTTLEYVKRN